MELSAHRLGDLRHKAIIASAILVGIVAVILLLRTDAGTSSGVRSADAASVFGLGRTHIGTTPGATLSGELGLPKGYESAKVSYTIVGSKESGGVNVSGTGTQFEFRAPSSGSVVLKATAKGSSGTISTQTTFDVQPIYEYAGTDLEYQGTVLIDGGRAVAGEAIPSGTMVDTTDGEVSYRSRISADGALGGRTELSGTKVEVEATNSGSRVMNNLNVARDSTEVRRLEVHVEPNKDKLRATKVTTPDAVAMVKGTTFDVTVTPDDSGVGVEEGIVYTFDRFRYYNDGENLTAGQSTTIEALEFAKQADLASNALQAGGGTSDEAPAAVSSDSHEHALLDEYDNVLEQTQETQLVEEIAPPPSRNVGDGVADGHDETQDPDPDGGNSAVGGPGGPTPGGSGPAPEGGTGSGPPPNGGGTTPPPTGGGPGPNPGGGGTPPPPGGGSTGGTGGDPTGTGGTTGGGGTSGGNGSTNTGTGTNPGGNTTTGGGTSSGGGSTTDPKPDPKPPADRNYNLEDFDQYGFNSCLGTHTQWNTGAVGPHRCVQRTRLTQLFDTKHVYRSLFEADHDFGCYSPHGVWRRDTNRDFCFPAAPSVILGFNNYPRLLIFAGGQVTTNLAPCSTPTALVDGLCKRP